MTKGKRLSVNMLAVKIVLCLIFTSIYHQITSAKCIDSRFGERCDLDKDCYQFGEHHLYCNKTGKACAFQVHTYASQSEANTDCPGVEFSAEPWSNPISFDWMTNALGVDCMRLCLLTESCFAISVFNHKCYLKNEKCFSHLKHVQGSLFGVLSVTREDYRCGCRYPFKRRASDGEILLWNSDCPESQLDRNPYRCCSDKGLCVKCENGLVPISRSYYDEQAATALEGRINC